MVSLKQLFEWFTTGKFPTEAQFAEQFKSFWHKSERIPQEQVFGLNNALDDKASKDDLANATTKFKGYHSSIEKLLAEYPQAKNEKDFFAWVGSPYPGTVYKVYVDGGAWTDTGEVPTQQEIDLAEYAKKTDLETKADETNNDGTVVRESTATNKGTYFADESGNIGFLIDENNKFKAKTDFAESSIVANGAKDTYFADEAGNIAFYVDTNGKFRAKSDFAESALVADGTKNTYFVDERGNIGFYITASGQFVGNVSDVVSIANELGKAKNKAISQGFFTEKYWELRFLIDGTLPPLEFDVIHIIVLGQSLTMGYAANPVLPALGLENALMFARTRTQGLNDANYIQFNQLQEMQVGNEGETPCSGVAQGMNLSYLENEGIEIPYKVLFTAPGIGGTAIPGGYAEGGNIYNKCMQDVQKAKALCDSLGLTYKVGIINWGQGEQNYDTSIDSYKSTLSGLVALYNQKIKEITGQADDIPFISYQTTVNKASYYGSKKQYPALAQWELSLENPLFYMAAPIYNLQLAGDKVHLTNVSSRLMGNSLGRINYRVLNDDYTPFKPILISKASNVVILTFDRKLAFDSQTLANNGFDLSEINTNAGFFPIDAGGNALTATTVLNADEKSIKITCSAEPSKLYYGFSKPDTYTVGGFVREKEQLDAYEANKLSLYMPNQIINL